MTKIVKIIMLACFVSCSSVKNNSDSEKSFLGKVIDDYSNDYRKFISKNTLEAIIIYIGENQVSISDAPKEIINSSNNIKDRLIGKYKNIYFELYGIKNFKHETVKKIISDINFNILQQKNDELKGIMLEYEPYLEIDYTYKNKTKQLKLFGNQNIKMKWGVDYKNASNK